MGDKGIIFIFFVVLSSVETTGLIRMNLKKLKEREAKLSTYRFETLRIQFYAGTILFPWENIYQHKNQ